MILDLAPRAGHLPPPPQQMVVPTSDDKKNFESILSHFLKPTEVSFLAINVQ